MRWDQPRAEVSISTTTVPEAGRALDPFAAESPVLSASALETAGRCPLAFFFRNGLHLYALEEIDVDPDHWIDAAQFGSLLHEVFRQFMESQRTRRAQAGHQHVPPGEARRGAQPVSVRHWRAGGVKYD